MAGDAVERRLEELRAGEEAIANHAELLANRENLADPDDNSGTSSSEEKPS